MQLLAARIICVVNLSCINSDKTTRQVIDSGSFPVTCLQKSTENISVVVPVVSCIVLVGSWEFVVVHGSHHPEFSTLNAYKCCTKHPDHHLLHRNLVNLAAKQLCVPSREAGAVRV